MDTPTCPSCRAPVPITPEMGSHKWVACACGTEFAIPLDEPPEIRQRDAAVQRDTPIQRDTPVKADGPPSGLQLGVQAAPPPVLDFEPGRNHDVLPVVLIGGLLASILGLGLLITHALNGGDEKTIERIPVSRVEPEPSIERIPAEQMPASDSPEQAEAIGSTRYDDKRPSEPAVRLPSVDSEEKRDRRPPEKR